LPAAGAAPEPARAVPCPAGDIELWLFMVIDPQTGKRRRTTYGLTLEEARERYVDPEPIPGSLERHEAKRQGGWALANVRSNQPRI
jgi:hypothetical protein